MIEPELDEPRSSFKLADADRQDATRGAFHLSLTMYGVAATKPV